MEHLEYTYVRAEKNNDFVIFLKVEPKWLDKEIDLIFDEDKLVINIDNKSFSTKTLGLDLIENFERKKTSIVFIDDEGQFIAETTISPKKRKLGL